MTSPDRPRQEPHLPQSITPPGETWQACARQLIDRAESALWDERGRDALAWLHARGLNDDTIRAARLGYIPKDMPPMKAESWGNPRGNTDPIHLYESVLIPGVIAGKVWYLKMRLLHPCNPKDKFRGIRGNESTALYLADFITNDRPAVSCEGELDALLLKQEVKDLASVFTLGSATNTINLVTWGMYLLRPSCFILAHDTDDAGENGANKLTWLHDAYRLKIPQLREGDKDLTDFHKSGGNLYSLIESVVREDAPIFVTWKPGINPTTIHGQYWKKPQSQHRSVLSAC